MYITYSPAEKRRVLFFHCAENENQRRPERAFAGEDRPMRVHRHHVAGGEARRSSVRRSSRRSGGY